MIPAKSLNDISDMQSWLHPKMLMHPICEFSHSGYLRSQHRMEWVVGNKGRKRIEDTRMAWSTTLLLPTDRIPRVISAAPVIVSYLLSCA